MLPTTIYYVEVLPGGTPLGFRQRGGKIFTRLKAAQDHKASLDRQGVICKIMTVQSPDWVAVDWHEES